MTHKIDPRHYSDLDELNDEELDDLRNEELRGKIKKHEAQIRRSILSEAKEIRRQERIESEIKRSFAHLRGDEQDGGSILR